MAEQLIMQRARQDAMAGNHPATILIIDGKPDKCWTFYQGDLRIRLLHADKNTAIAGPPSQELEANFVLEITAEPRVKEFSIAACDASRKGALRSGAEADHADELCPQR